MAKKDKFKFLEEDDMLAILTYTKIMAVMSKFHISLETAISNSDLLLFSSGPISEKIFIKGQELANRYKPFVCPIGVDSSVPAHVTSARLMGMPRYSVGFMRIKFFALDEDAEAFYKFVWFVTNDFFEIEEDRLSILNTIYNLEIYTKQLDFYYENNFSLHVTRLTRYTFMVEEIIDNLSEQRFLCNLMECHDHIWSIQYNKRNGEKLQTRLL
jgi:hypothetical protein